MSLEFFVERDAENGLPWLKVRLPCGAVHNILWLEQDNEEGIRAVPVGKWVWAGDVLYYDYEQYTKEKYL